MNKLLSELKQIIVEYDFTYRWAVIEKMWELGRELSDSKWHLKEADIEQIADYMDIHENNLWDAIHFYKLFPDLSLLPEGKNISWSSLKSKYLS